MADTRPICVPCAARYEPIKNGVDVSYADTGVQEGDLYQCTACGHKLVTGLAREAVYPDGPDDRRISLRRAASVVAA